MVDASHEKEARAKDTITSLKTEIANLSRLVEQGAGLSVGQENTVRAAPSRPEPPPPSLLAAPPQAAAAAAAGGTAPSRRRRRCWRTAPSRRCCCCWLHRPKPLLLLFGGTAASRCCCCWRHRPKPLPLLLLLHRVKALLPARCHMALMPPPRAHRLAPTAVRDRAGRHRVERRR